MKNWKPVTLSLVVLFTLLSCSQEKAPLGSRKNPLKIYFTPSVDANQITSTSKVFMQYLEKETGLYFESAIPASFVAVVEAFGSSRVDVAVMNSFGYLMANQRYGAQAKLTTVRHGRDSYRGQIITRADSGINSLKDLQGKSFAFTDPSSTSGYLLPKKLLTEKSIKLKNTVFANKHDNVVTMVYQKQVDAGATFYSPPAGGRIRDARGRVTTQFPDVEEKVKIIALTDWIKNDPFVFRKDLPQDISKKIVSAIKGFLKTPNGKKVFEQIYDIVGVVDTTDKDYDTLRDMIRVVGVDLEELLN